MILKNIVHPAIRLKCLCGMILIFVYTHTQAQDTTGTMRKELYISFVNFSPLNFSLKYKKQIAPKRYFKIGLVALSANISSSKAPSGASFPITNSSYSGGIELGIEFRKAITKKLSLFHGPSLNCIYQYSLRKDLNPSVPQNQQKKDSDVISGSIPYTIGCLFQVYTNFHVAAEINPSIYGSYRRSEVNANGGRGTSYDGGLGFDNRYAGISLVYRY
jgi:hypothetical protein